MVRQMLGLVAKSSIRSIRPTYRLISHTTRKMGEGDTGATRSGGQASSDAFSKREAANENKYVKEKEMEKLRVLKTKIDEHKKQLEELDKHVDDQINVGKDR